MGADGQSYRGAITNEFFDQSGEGSGEIGPGHATGSRVKVEAPSTPIASFEEFFEEGEASLRGHTDELRACHATGLGKGAKPVTNIGGSGLRLLKLLCTGVDHG